MKIVVDIKRVEQNYVLDTQQDSFFLVFEVGGREIRVPTTESEVQKVIIDAKRKAAQSHLVSVPHTVGWVEPEAPPVGRIGAPLPDQERYLRQLGTQADVEWSTIEAALQDGDDISEVAETLQTIIAQREAARPDVGKVFVPPQFEDVIQSPVDVPEGLFEDTARATQSDIDAFYSSVEEHEGSSDDLEDSEGPDLEDILNPKSPERPKVPTATQQRKANIKETLGNRPVPRDVIAKLRERAQQVPIRTLAPHQVDEAGAPDPSQIPQKRAPTLPGLDDEGFAQG